jgi:hypothetical protein
MPLQLLPLAFLALHALGASAVPPPPGKPGPPGGNGPFPIGPAMASISGSEWATGSPYTSSLVASGVSETASGTATSASAPAFSTTVSYSNGTTRSLASCAASLNGSLPTTSGFTFNGTVRRYYVAAEEVEWDYAPTGWDNWLGVR